MTTPSPAPAEKPREPNWLQRQSPEPDFQRMLSDMLERQGKGKHLNELLMAAMKEAFAAGQRAAPQQGVDTMTHNFTMDEAHSEGYAEAKAEAADRSAALEAALLPMLLPTGWVLDHLCEHWSAQSGTMQRSGGWTAKLAGFRDGAVVKAQGEGSTAAEAITAAKAKAGEGWSDDTVIEAACDAYCEADMRHDAGFCNEKHMRRALAAAYEAEADALDKTVGIDCWTARHLRGRASALRGDSAS